jgi:GTP-binding protein Era
VKAGLVSLLGRPNAGKSTLLNRLVGQKVAIVSDKPQTTRTRILGVKNYPDGQIVFVDTPGVHKPTHRLNRRMVEVALAAMREVDVVALVVDVSALSGRPGAPRRAAAAPDSLRLGPGDRYLLDALKELATPTILVLNKVDLIAKHRLLPIIEHYRRSHSFVEFIPVSAVDGTNVEALERALLQYLPDGEPMYPPDYLTDQPERFYAAEIVREKVLQLTHDELPHSTAVVVDRFEEPGAARAGGEEAVTAPDVIRLYCTILVERESQKPIVVGRGGSMIKQIGTAARAELIEHFGANVYLDLHVKVKAEWRNDARVLDELGVRARE